MSLLSTLEQELNEMSAAGTLKLSGAAKRTVKVKRLKAENKRLREDVAILKAATTFFAGELDPRNR